ncbi:MAG: hypothetical protein ACFFAX_16320 [Promethearchaeota archaeon]
MFIDIGHWKISRENSEEFRNLASKFVNYQRATRDEWPYKEAYFYMMVTEDQSVESWKYIDIFDNTEDFEKMDGTMNKVFEREPEVKAVFDRVFEIMVPDTWKTIQWTEVEEFRIE